jgi:5'-deoxynucleotidase YfbR-like HD superfamily hydrolase
MSAPTPTPLWLSGRVMRWHTNPRMAGTGDRLDGHHARVAQIIIEVMAPEQPSASLLIAALTHDAGEMVVGDLPGPYKSNVAPSVAADHALTEAAARDTIAGPYPDLTESEATYLRYADRLDAYLFAQHMGMDMMSMEWRICREEIARLAAMLGTIVKDNAWDGFDRNEVVPL